MTSAEACASICGECSDAAPTRKPTRKPTPQDDSCEDSTSWYYKKRKNTCEKYVTKKSKYCKAKDEDGVSALDACALTCGVCDKAAMSEEPPSTDACFDSTSWYFKKAKNSCQAYVAKDPDRYCGIKYVDESDVPSAEACAATCGSC